MKELKEGKIGSAELADWYGGITANTFSKNREQRIALINKYYCDIIAAEEQGKYYVSNIRIKVYNKRIKDNLLREIFIDSWLDGEGDIVSQRINRLMPQYLERETKKLAESTIRKNIYTLKKEWLGGMNRKTKMQEDGIRGRCPQNWCKMIDGKYSPLTFEEMRIRGSIIDYNLKKLNQANKEKAQASIKALESDFIDFTTFKSDMIKIGGGFNWEEYEEDLIKAFGYPLACVNVFYERKETQTNQETIDWLNN